MKLCSTRFWRKMWCPAAIGKTREGSSGRARPIASGGARSCVRPDRACELRLLGVRRERLSEQYWSEAGSREIVVTPAADERSLRYAEWVRANRARVTEATGDRVGYVHVFNVEQPGVDAFRKQWRAQRGQVAAMIVDVRNNSGGTRTDDVLDWIARKPTRLMYDRRGRVPPAIGPFLDGPKVMIANDQSGSGGDELAYFFKRAKLGPLVGNRTLGGMIGDGASYKITGGWTLLVPTSWPLWPGYGKTARPIGLTPGSLASEGNQREESLPPTFARWEIWTVRRATAAEFYSKMSRSEFSKANAGYTGTGFIDYGGNGSYVQWDYVAVPAAGTCALTFRYANGSGVDRQCEIWVNGTSQGNLSFEPTGSAITWKTASITAKLNAGNNTIRVIANTANGGPSLDKMDVAGHSAAVTK